MDWYRYCSHVVVVTTVLALLSVTVATSRSGVSQAPVPGTAQNSGIDGVSLSLTGAILVPVALPTSPVPSHAPIIYSVQPADDLALIANRFAVSVDDLLWSNPDLRARPGVAPRERLLIPPVPGMVVAVRTGDTITSLAQRYRTSAESIVDFNYLRTSALHAGQMLVIPEASGPEIPGPTIIARTAASGIVSPVGSQAENIFPYGYCTWYVATRVRVTWRGDAGYWFAGARGHGYRVGITPKVGSIMVTRESAFGHVAYVEQVNPNGSWVVSEMNYVGWGIIDQRTIEPGQVPLVGFIY